jgi:uncharacterized protein (TIGR00159 family)
VILILVVVFQNDIRRALMRMGSQPWFGFARARESQAIDEVVDAATELAKHRIGAIITFEQDANLDEFVGVNKGHDLDAAMSSELLVSIFIPEGVNKLHDGAVIIRNLRIAKAGVFFPMPDSRVLDPSFGSRHRAALGITEETDAVVVVVSEERGTISFCFNGNIVGNLDGPGLRRALEGVFAPSRRRRKKGAPSATTKAVPVSARVAAETSRVDLGPASRRSEPPPPSREDPTLVSVPSEPGETPTTRIHTTEPELPPAAPPAPLRKAKVDRADAEAVPLPASAPEIRRLAPLTTPMRAPSTPLTRPGPGEPSSGPGSADDDGRTPDSTERGGAR